MIEVIVSGAAGRLGAKILEKALSSSELEVVGAIVRPGSALDGADVGQGIKATGEADSLMKRGVVWIETAPAAPALDNVRSAAKAGAHLLVATTGFTPESKREIESFAKDVPVLIAPNLSPGIAVLTDLVERASAALADYDLEISEIHHKRKRDAPSGTAWALAAAGASARGRDIQSDAILARAGETGPRGTDEIGMQALRGGEVIGEHTVYLFGPTERVELTHRAQSRDVFADGAIRAARFLGAENRAAGLYTMRDALGLR